MIRRSLSLAVLLTVAASPLFALNPGQDIIVPAAGRGGGWVTDLYVSNPGDFTVSVTVEWLVRNQANPNPNGISFDLPAGATEILDDVIFNDFNLTSAGGAFRVTADGDVAVNSRIYFDDTDNSQTFGQGFEGVPTWAATQSGGTATVVGLTYNDAFRTNVYATAGANGAIVQFRLVDPDGAVIATASLTLDAYQPYLRRVDQLFSGLQNFDNATLIAEISEGSGGSAVFGASKVDNISTDPTTLESTATGGGGGIDGTYQFAVYDSLSFAAGGNLMISGGEVTAIVGTYFNWDKGDPQNPDCTLLFQWGQGLTDAPVGDFADGVTFSDSYQSTGSGVMTWTLTFEPGDGADLSGSLEATGSEFTGQDTGCNGEFPTLNFFAGKSN
jgi:hypothetical protein